MKCRLGLVWDSNILFSRYIEECGVTCEHITPHIIAAPFFRSRLCALVIPTGFANPAYSRLLPALKASAPRIRRFVEGGGNLIVFGAATDRSDAYDWLPFRIAYHHAYGQQHLAIDHDHPLASIVEGYDTGCIECDGYLTEHEGTVIASAGENAVMILSRIGKGQVVVTTIHEYPSGRFLKTFSSAPEETLF